MSEPVILPRLEGDSPLCNRVSLDVFSFIKGLAAALHLEHTHGYDEMQDDLWLRISHGDMHALLKARPA
jgi:hypothetical protein